MVISDWSRKTVKVGREGEERRKRKRSAPFAFAGSNPMPGDLWGVVGEVAPS